MAREVENCLNTLVDTGYTVGRALATSLGGFVDDLQRSTMRDAAGKVAVVAGDLSVFAVTCTSLGADTVLPMAVGYSLGAWMKPEIHKRMYSFTPPRMLMTTISVIGALLGSSATVAAVGGMFIFNRACKHGWLQLNTARR